MNKGNIIYIHLWVIFLAILSVVICTYGVLHADTAITNAGMWIGLLGMYSVGLVVITIAITTKDSKIDLLHDILAKMAKGGNPDE